MLTTSCLLMLPTLVSDTRNFWKAAKGGNLRMTFFGVVMDQASESGYQGTAVGGLTVTPSWVMRVISGMYLVWSRRLTARAWPLDPQKRKLLGSSRLRAAQNSARSSSGRLVRVL